MNKLIRIGSLSAAGVILASALTGCSAYNNPEKYIKAPSKGSISIKQSEINDKYAETMEGILETYRETEYTELTDKEELVKDGDQVNIDFEGRAGEDGLTLTEDQLKHMKAEGSDLVIGSNSMIGAYTSGTDESKKNKGFEEQIIGHKVGDKFDITVTFPDSYSSDKALQGKVVIFSIKINKLSRAYVNDDTTVTVDYKFAYKEEKKDDDPDLSKKFKADDFEIDYTEEIDKEAKFNELFSVSDYADKFKKQPLDYEYSFDYTVPDDVTTDYKDYIGKTITVTLTVSDITHLPEWTDELVKDYTSEQYKTVAEYDEFIMKNIKASLTYDKIVAETTVNSWPKSERKKIYKNYVDQLVYKQLGNQSPSAFTKEELDKKLTAEIYDKIYAEAASSTLTALKERLVLEYLFDVYDITISNKDYNTRLEKMFNDNFTSNIYAFYQMGIMDVKSFEAYYGKDTLKLQFKSEDLMEKILDYSTVEADV